VTTAQTGTGNEALANLRRQYQQGYLTAYEFIRCLVTQYQAERASHGRRIHAEQRREEIAAFAAATVVDGHEHFRVQLTLRVMRNVPVRTAY
jgi:hypothetical protein